MLDALVSLCRAAQRSQARMLKGVCSQNPRRIARAHHEASGGLREPARIAPPARLGKGNSLLGRAATASALTRVPRWNQPLNISKPSSPSSSNPAKRPSGALQAFKLNLDFRPLQRGKRPPRHTGLLHVFAASRTEFLRVGLRGEEFARLFPVDLAVADAPTASLGGRSSFSWGVLFSAGEAAWKWQKPRGMTGSRGRRQTARKRPFGGPFVPVLRRRKWSERQDLNLRQPAPKAGALPS